MKHYKSENILISCGLVSILFVIFLYKGIVQNALFLLLLIFNALSGELVFLFKEKGTSLCCYFIILLLSLAAGVYYLMNGNGLLGVLSFLALVFPSFRLAARRKE